VNYAAVLTALWLGAAVLTPGVSARPGDPPPPKDPAPLGGPGVRDRGAPGRTFGEPSGNKGDAKFAQRPPAHGAFLGGVRFMASEQAPDDVRLSSEQADQIKAIEREFQEQVRAFKASHADEIKALRAKAGLPPEPAGGAGQNDGNGERRRGPRAGGGGGAGGEGLFGPGDREKLRGLRDDPKLAEVRDEFRKLMESAPKPDDVQARQWGVLNEKQQNFLKDHLAHMRDQMQDGRPARKRGPGGEGPGAQDGQGGPGGPGARDGGPRRGPGGPDGQRPPRERRRGNPPPGGDRPGNNAPPPPPAGQGDEPMNAPPPPSDE